LVVSNTRGAHTAKSDFRINWIAMGNVIEAAARAWYRTASQNLDYPRKAGKGVLTRSSHQLIATNIRGGVRCYGIACLSLFVVLVYQLEDSFL